MSNTARTKKDFSPDYTFNLRCKKFLLRQSDKCALCGEKFEKMGDVTIDHIIPLSKGGPHALSNMQLAHFECNVKKGNNVLG